LDFLLLYQTANVGKLWTVQVRPTPVLKKNVIVRHLIAKFVSLVTASFLLAFK
jgi:hypothetical protein